MATQLAKAYICLHLLSQLVTRSSSSSNRPRLVATPTVAHPILLQLCNQVFLQQTFPVRTPSSIESSAGSMHAKTLTCSNFVI